MKGNRTWIPAFEHLGIDFANNYQASRHWMTGGNPFREPFGDPLNRAFAYPPLTLRAFAWCQALSERGAYRVWWAALVVLASLGAWAAWRTRRELGLWGLPLPCRLAAILWSTPVLFALERGNYDLLLLACLLPAAWALRGTTLTHDLVVGVCLAAATLLKAYPAVVILGLLPLRRTRALVCCGAAGLLLAGVGHADFLPWLENARRLSLLDSPNTHGGVHPTVHTLTGCWRLLWTDAPLGRFMTQVPRMGAGLGLVFALTAWTSYRLWRAGPRRGGLAVSSLAGGGGHVLARSLQRLQFGLPAAGGELAVWDRRDPVYVHLLMALLLLWWQPLLLGIDGKLLLGFKYLGLAAVGMSLVNRAHEMALGHGLAVPRPAASPPDLPAAA